MFVFAEQIFRESRATKSGVTEAQRDESAAKQWAMVPASMRRESPDGGKKVIEKEVEVVPEKKFPFELEYLWRYFQEISMGIQATGMSVPTISWDLLYS